MCAEWRVAAERYQSAGRRSDEKTCLQRSRRARRAFGMWAGRADLDEAWLAQRSERWRSRFAPSPVSGEGWGKG